MSGRGPASGVSSGAAGAEVNPNEIDRIVAGAHYDPHAVLGAHPGPGGVQVSGNSCRWPGTAAVVLPDGRRFPMAHLHEGVFGGTLPLAEVPDYRIAVAYPGPEPGSTGAGDGDRHPVPVPAHARRDRPAPDRRGQARGALAGARRARARVRLRRHRVRQGQRHRVRRLGTERAGCAGHRRLQPLGRARPPDALARRRRGSGSCSCPASATAPTTSSTSAAPTGGGGARPTRWPAAPSTRPPPRRWCSPPATPGATRSWLAGAAAAVSVPQRAGQHLRGAPRLLAAGPVLPRARRAS